MQPESGTPNMKLNAIARILSSCVYGKQLVLANKRNQCYKIKDYLKEIHNFNCEVALPSMPNDECKNIVASFRKGKLNILITTHGFGFNMPLPEITQVLHVFFPSFLFLFFFVCFV